MTGASLGSIFRPARILVSDSEMLNREIISRRLTSLGYVCECSEDNLSALEMIAAKSYDLFLTDIEMSKSSGAAFLREVLALRPNIAIILITPVVNIEVAVDALKHGAYDYITKPFSMEEISLSVSRALEKRRLLLENDNYQRTLEDQVASRTKQLKEALKVLEQTYHSTLVALSKALDSRDADPDGHTLRITAYAARLARQLGLSGPEIRVVEQGILLHDVGNIGIPDALLAKRESLDENEQLMMRRHPEIGHRILSSIKFLKEAARLVLEHHERYDGQGYPRGLKGEEIDLGARIYTVADAFDALVCPGSSGSIADFEEVCIKMRRMSGMELDPEIVERFLEVPFDEWKEISGAVAATAETAEE